MLKKTTIFTFITLSTVFLSSCMEEDTNNTDPKTNFKAFAKIYSDTRQKLIEKEAEMSRYFSIYDVSVVNRNFTLAKKEFNFFSEEEVYESIIDYYQRVPSVIEEVFSPDFDEAINTFTLNLDSSNLKLKGYPRFKQALGFCNNLMKEPQYIRNYENKYQLISGIADYCSNLGMINSLFVNLFDRDQYYTTFISGIRVEDKYLYKAKTNKYGFVWTPVTDTQYLDYIKNRLKVIYVKSDY